MKEEMRVLHFKKIALAFCCNIRLRENENKISLLYYSLIINPLKQFYSIYLRFLPMFACLVLGNMALLGQETLVDSLQNELERAKRPAKRAKLHNQLAFELLYVDSTEAKLQAKQALFQARIGRNVPETVEAYINLGRIKRFVYDFDSADYFYQTAEKLAIEGSYKKGQARSLNGLGTVHWIKGEYEAATADYFASLETARQATYLKGEADASNNWAQAYLIAFDGRKSSLINPYLSRALSNYRKLGDSVGVARTLLTLGDMFDYQQNYQEALALYLQALEIQTQLGNKGEIANSLSTIAYVYGENGDTLKAFSYYLDCLTLREVIGRASGLIEAFNNAGLWLAMTGEPDRAIELFDKGLALVMQTRNSQRIGAYYASLGNVYWKYKGDFKLGRSYLLKAEPLLKEDSSFQLIYWAESFGTLEMEVGNLNAALQHFQYQLAISKQFQYEWGEEASYLNLSKAYKKLGDFEQAYAYSEQFHRLKDKLEDADEKKAMEELTIQYDTKQKDAEIARLELEKIERERDQATLLLTGVGILIFLLSAFFYYRYRQAKLMRLKQIDLERERVKQEQERVERLQQIDKLKDQFLANTSHELRTPLNGIIGLSEGMYEKTTDEFIRQNLAMVIASGKRLAALVNDLLDFSRLKHKDIKLTLKPLDLRALASLICQVSAPLAKGKKIQLENEIPTDMPPAYADEDRLSQVLFNLLSNAIKFTEAGSINIKARLVGDHLEVSVEDTGIGIPQDKLAVIFKEFEQVDGSTERTFVGTGLGLSISKNLVEAHGGTMWVTSHLGEGSKFFFTLPAALHQEAVGLNHANAPVLTPLIEMPADYASSTPEVPNKQVATRDVFFPQKVTLGNEGPSRILIVDDEPINHQVLTNHFDGQYQLVMALHGAEALEIIDTQPMFDLVLLDVMMPKMSGFEVSRRIRERYSPSELPIILLTAKNQVADLVMGLSTGANDYIAKPFAKDEFLARVKTHLNLHKINQATGKFVPYEFIRTLGRDTISDVQVGDHVEKEVTVLFSDIRGYTALSEKMSPAEAFRFVFDYVQRMGPIVYKNRGFINQYLGDGIMAIFQGDPLDAIHAAIDMQIDLRTWNQERVQAGEKAIAVGIGMHTGPLIMGIIGDEVRSDATTISDTVNTASRMEGLTKYYHAQILISEDVYQHLRPDHNLNFRYLGKVQVKGKQQPVNLYECYDGDPPEIFMQKHSGKAIFEEGVHQYIAANFLAAGRSLKAALRAYPSDSLAHQLLIQVNQHLEQGTPDGWTGVETMTQK